MNKLLQRQIRKHLDYPEEIPKKLSSLLQVISDSYDHYEKDRNMIDRSMEISSNEMVELNNNLRKEKDELLRIDKELEKSLSILEATLESTADGILVTDNNGNIIRFNNKFAELWRIPEKILATRDDNLALSFVLDQLVDPESFLSKVKALYAQPEATSFDILEFKDGSTFERYSQSQVVNGVCVGRVWNFRDVTERKNTERIREKITADLIQHNKNLEQFAYIVSHNLRAPVANIIGTADILNDIDLDEEERKTITKELSALAEKLDEVIKDLNNILQVKREVNQKKEPVLFSNTVENITSSLSHLINKEQVEIKTDFSEIDEITTLKSYLHSIFYNLISNSIKYKQPHLNLLIEIKSYKQEDNVILLVKDNGLGIDLTKQREKVFGMYKRFHNHIEGKGMGLFMVKTQVETLNGIIEVHSEVNKGTEFIIKFETEE